MRFYKVLAQHSPAWPPEPPPGTGAVLHKVLPSVLSSSHASALPPSGQWAPEKLCPLAQNCTAIKGRVQLELGLNPSQWHAECWPPNPNAALLLTDWAIQGKAGSTWEG